MKINAHPPNGPARKRLYELYIQPHIGKKKASKIIENDINKIRKFMETHGYSKQNKNGSSIRNIEKWLISLSVGLYLGAKIK